MDTRLKRVTVLPYPLTPELLNVERLAQRRERRNGKHVLFAARHDPVKGADVLLRAVPLVRQKVPDAVFDLYGYEPRPDEELPDGVVCHGFVPKEQLLREYRTADLCVLPSRWDNSPNAIYEAMAAGKAVVASRVGGIPELVAGCDTGLLVPPGQPEPLSEAVAALLLDDERRVRMGRQGRRRIQRLADLKENVDQRLDIYHRVIQQHLSRSRAG
jgi:glycosyltransferase involved in cell wall biosynthesis